MLGFGCVSFPSQLSQLSGKEDHGLAGSMNEDTGSVIAVGWLVWVCGLGQLGQLGKLTVLTLSAESAS